MLQLAAALALMALAQAMPAQSAERREPVSDYRVALRIPGPDGLWDYASVDVAARRLYVGREGGILAMDLTNNVVVPVLFASPVVHQVLPLNDGRLIATTGESNEAVIVEAATGKVLARVRTGDDPDAVAFDSRTGLAITFNRGGRDATIFDVAHARVAGSLKLPGAPEFAAADGNGTVYVNIASSNEIAVIDLLKRKIARHLPLSGCEEPTGLALDAAAGVLLAACGNGIAKAITKDGRELATLEVGREPDAAILDARRKLAFIPSGGDGTLTVISLADRNDIKVVQRLSIQRGTRTGTVDPQTGKLYLPAGKLLPPKPPAKWPSVVPGSFEIIVVEPSSAARSTAHAERTP
jgi:DNA-binding beta-propeller fold protein YncE